MMRKPSQFLVRATVVPFGQGNTQNFAGPNGILPKRFVKVPHAKEQQRTGIFGLYLVILAVEGRFIFLRG